MKKFTEYLEKRGYKLNTIREHLKNLRHFNNWCEENNANPNSASLNKLYEYQEHNTNSGCKLGAIKSRIRTLKCYYHFTKRKVNPALLVRSEKRQNTLPKNLLEQESLINLYISTVPRTASKKRNKIMLGLVLFQGARREDLGLIELEHVDFEKKRIFIPATHTSNQRYVPLMDYQRLDLQNYIYELRPQLLIQAKKETNKLFFSFGSGEGLNNSLSFLTDEVKANNSYFKSLIQVRQSRISIWQKELGTRQAQYLSGMRYASSIERYKTSHTDSLREKLKLIHPMQKFGM